MNEIQNKKRILIIDDDAFISGMVAELLIEAGHEVEIAGSGEEGLHAISSQPNLVLLDLGLTGVDGFEILEKIHGSEQSASIPVIVFSNFSDKEDITKSLSLGAKKHIVKAETTPKGIVTEINTLLASS